MAKRTALYEAHLQNKGQMIEFAGYELPVQFSAGLVKEHLAVREDKGVFDVSHMGEALVEGPNAATWLDYVLTNRISTLQPGRICYSFLLNEKGGTVDDLLVYCFNPQRFMLVLNASNKDKDVAVLKSYLPEKGVVLSDISEDTSQIALQGPGALAYLSGHMDAGLIPGKYYSFSEAVPIAGRSVLLSRNGYTGEDGVEIYGAHEDIKTLFELFVSEGVQPCGLGARDTLRLEAGMPLYGHELSEARSPMEAGLGFFVKMDKADFVGKKALESFVPAQARVGLRMTGRGIAREGCPILAEGREVGLVTSGTQLPSLKFAAAMGYVDTAYRAPGTALEVDVRGRKVTAEVVSLPFYKRPVQ